jgi:hypothetical protein
MPLTVLYVRADVLSGAVSFMEIAQFHGAYVRGSTSVSGLPYIRPVPNISAVAGEPLYVACPVAGYPIDSIVWQKGK